MPVTEVKVMILLKPTNVNVRIQKDCSSKKKKIIWEQIGIYAAHKNQATTFFFFLTHQRHVIKWWNMRCGNKERKNRTKTDFDIQTLESVGGKCKWENIFAPEMLRIFVYLYFYMRMQNTLQTNRYRDKITKHILHVALSQSQRKNMCVWHWYATYNFRLISCTLEITYINQVNCKRKCARRTCTKFVSCSSRNCFFFSLTFSSHIFCTIVTYRIGIILCAPVIHCANIFISFSRSS